MRLLSLNVTEIASLKWETNENSIKDGFNVCITFIDTAIWLAKIHNEHHLSDDVRHVVFVNYQFLWFLLYRNSTIKICTGLFALKYFHTRKFHVTRLIIFNILSTPAKFNTISIQHLLALSSSFCLDGVVNSPKLLLEIK